MPNSNENNMVQLGIAAVVAFIIGMSGGYMIGNSMKPDDATSNNTSTTMDADHMVDGVTVGGAKMVRTKDIVDNAVKAKNVTTLVTAVKAADLVETLKSEGPFTVFAPTNEAFAALPEGTVDNLLNPENKEMLSSILTYHVVPGTFTTAALKTMASKGETLTTVQGETLSFVTEDNMLKVMDAKGNKVAIETPDVISSNGVTHVIKAVLMHS
jgi:uncharacterized surface protein with fasciclin (FAS1) repeats